MIKLFRTSRYDPMDKSKTEKHSSPTGRYIKYAVGEILLVMVGILLALQVNNWNQQRIDSNKEKLLLTALHNEFVENKSQLEEVVSWHHKALISTQYMISQFPIDPETIDLDTLTERTKFWGYRWTFNPSQGVIRSLVNTSSFGLITDQELRLLIVTWQDVLFDYQEEETVAAISVRERLGPELQANCPWGTYNDDRFDKNYLATFQFENLFYSRENNLIDILGVVPGEGELERIRHTIDRIIELSETDK